MIKASEKLFKPDECIKAGGAGRVALLQYCVRSVTPEPIFLFASAEYRLRPSHHAALAIYDVFCAVGSPARIRVPDALPPKELRLAAAVKELRALATQSAGHGDNEEALARQIPARFDLFEPLSTALYASQGGPLAALAGCYDPSLTPDQNLPGGRMSASQQYFRDKVWLPVVRPRLVSAGFWQLGAID